MNKPSTVAASLAGFLFQPDRLLFLLSQNHDPNLSVAIEYFDDVSVLNADGVPILLEQDKKSITPLRNNLTDHGHELWNTICNWISVIQTSNINVEKTKFVLATNKAVDEGSLIKRMHNANTDEQVVSIISDLKNNPPSDKYQSAFQDIKILQELIKNFQIHDDSTSPNMDNEISKLLRLGKKHSTIILQALKGWMHDCITNSLDRNEPAIITVEAFNRALDNIKLRTIKASVTVQAKDLVSKEILENARQESYEKIFVKQLEFISHQDLDEIIADSIDDYLCSMEERYRLAFLGEVSNDAIKSMDFRNSEHWKQVVRNSRAEDSSKTKEVIGYKIFADTIDNSYVGTLDGVTVDAYFTRGSFHILSDSLKIGWHPDWNTLLSKKSYEQS